MSTGLYTLEANDGLQPVRLPRELVDLAAEIAEFEGLTMLEAFGLAAVELPTLATYAREWDRDLMGALYEFPL